MWKIKQIFDGDFGLWSEKGDVMIILIESVILCAIFTLMVFIMSRKPINTLYNYPPRIQERVKSLDEYKDSIPTQKNDHIVPRFFTFLSYTTDVSRLFQTQLSRPAS